MLSREHSKVSGDGSMCLSPSLSLSASRSVTRTCVMSAGMSKSSAFFSSLGLRGITLLALPSRAPPRSPSFPSLSLSGCLSCSLAPSLPRSLALSLYLLSLSLVFSLPPALRPISALCPLLCAHLNLACIGARTRGGGRCLCCAVLCCVLGGVGVLSTLTVSLDLLNARMIKRNL